MVREIQNTKQLWVNPQITEIKVKMTEGHYGQGHQEHGQGHGYGHQHHGQGHGYGHDCS